MEAQFRNLVAGRTAGLGPFLARSMLAVAAVPYRAAVALRNGLYSSGALRATSLPVPVISIGNITLGGTGKTPFVELVCRWLSDRGKHPVIVSRGYGARAGPNDEARMLEANLPDVPHVQGKDRVAAARRAIELWRPDAIVLDDGFQHRRLDRQLDIVLIDCLEPFGYGRLFPRGLLREPLTGLRRADLVVLSRANLCSDDERLAILARVHHAAGEKPILLAEHRPTVLRSRNGETAAIEMLHGAPVAAFCGIGNPRGFWKTLQQLGCKLSASISFPDHHAYGPHDLNTLEALVQAADAEAVITTQKDLVKLDANSIAGRPLFALEIETAITDPARLLERALRRALESVVMHARAA